LYTLIAEHNKKKLIGGKGRIYFCCVDKNCWISNLSPFLFLLYAVFYKAENDGTIQQLLAFKTKFKAKKIGRLFKINILTKQTLTRLGSNNFDIIQMFASCLAQK
jgi:hypothetical protein